MLDTVERLLGPLSISSLVVSAEASYLMLLFGLLIVPKILQRFRIPSAVTCFMFGAFCGPGFALFQDDPTVTLFSTLGISSLFLFAGLEVSGAELRREARVLTEHLILRVASLLACALALSHSLDLEPRVSALVALAILTPSTGFILDSLPALRLSQAESFWVRAKAIGTEILALTILFVVLQSGNRKTLALSALALLALVVALPVAFRAFARFIVPHAPKTEFAFLLMVAVLCALATEKLGVYYLVGAFVVGMAAQRFRTALPSLASARMLGAVEAFASLFVPFYFFHAGLALSREAFSWTSLGLGVAFVALVLPLRLGLVWAHRRLRFGEPLSVGLRIGIPMLPTTVFTLVIVEILRDTFKVSPAILGALVIFAIANTMAPSVLLRKPVPEFEDELMLGPDHVGYDPPAS